ncbi:MAG TPA: hypothetical protein VGL77_02360 [Armatimonadota bacterium]
MTQPRSKVTLVTDLDEIMQDMVPQPVLMVRPRMNRKHPDQRMHMTAEVVDLTTLNLAKMQTFEIL